MLTSPMLLKPLPRDAQSIRRLAMLTCVMRVSVLLARFQIAG
jgi:hypothetical protein